MGRGRLTDEELSILKKSPYVSDVSEMRIIYTNEFKHHFMNEYNSGKKPAEIFREAGLDPKILGSKRIERAAFRWRESYAAGTLGSYQDGTIRQRNASQNQHFQSNSDYYHEKLKELEKKFEHTIQTQQEQIELLKKELNSIRNAARD